LEEFIWLYERNSINHVKIDNYKTPFLPIFFAEIIEMENTEEKYKVSCNILAL